MEAAWEAGEKLEPPVGFEPTTYALRIMPRSGTGMSDTALIRELFDFAAITGMDVPAVVT